MHALLKSLWVYKVFFYKLGGQKTQNSSPVERIFEETWGFRVQRVDVSKLGSSLSPHVLFVQGCHHFFLFLFGLPLSKFENPKISWNILNWLVLQACQGHPQIRSLHGKIFARLVKSSVNQYVACQPKTAGYIFVYIILCVCFVNTYIHILTAVFLTSSW